MAAKIFKVAPHWGQCYRWISTWTPKITINDMPPGASRPEMFTLDRAKVSLRIPDLFKGYLVLPEIRVSEPRLLLEKNAEGKANWDFGIPPREEGKKPAEPADVGATVWAI